MSYQDTAAEIAAFVERNPGIRDIPILWAAAQTIIARGADAELLQSWVGTPDPDGWTDELRGALSRLLAYDNTRSAVAEARAAEGSDEHPADAVRPRGSVFEWPVNPAAGDITGTPTIWEPRHAEPAGFVRVKDGRITTDLLSEITPDDHPLGEETAANLRARLRPRPRPDHG